MRVTIERMRAEDVDAVALLQASAFPGRSGEPASATGRIEEAQLREELARPWARIWVARAEGAASPVGFLLAWHVADELHVLNVATCPAHRRRGVGRTLVDHALAFAVEQRGRLVLLEVRRSNRAAIALYRAAGFHAMGVRRAYYSDGEDAVEMACALDPETGARIAQPDEIRLDDG